MKGPGSLFNSSKEEIASVDPITGVLLAVLHSSSKDDCQKAIQVASKQDSEFTVNRQSTFTIERRNSKCTGADLAGLKNI